MNSLPPLAPIPSLFDGKVCARCQQWKSFTGYHKDRKAKDGHEQRCKECVAAWHRDYYARNKERILARNCEGRMRDIEASRRIVRESMKKHRERNPEKTNIWARHNPERYQEIKRAWYERNKQWYNPKTIQWGKNNPERLRAIRSRRRARVQNAPGSYTAVQWVTLCDFYGNRCLRCGSAGPLTVDHVIPLSRGGANDISNLQPLCLGCNCSKHAKAIDYRPDRGAGLQGR